MVLSHTVLAASHSSATPRSHLVSAVNVLECYHNRPSIEALAAVRPQPNHQVMFRLHPLPLFFEARTINSSSFGNKFLALRCITFMPLLKKINPWDSTSMPFGERPSSTRFDGVVVSGMSLKWSSVMSFGKREGVK